MFEEVAEMVRAMSPDEIGEIRMRASRRGIKVWFGPETPPREHYEAQMLPRKYVDGTNGVAIEIGFHSEHKELAKNIEVIDHVSASEKTWRKILGKEAEVDVFFGADNWRRISEAWIEPDLDDPETPFEVASRLVDYVTVIEPARR